MCIRDRLSSICFVILFRVSYYAWVYCQPKKRKHGEGKRLNEFAEWPVGPVAWLAKWHNYAEFNMRRLNVSGSTYDDNQKSTKAHLSISLFRTATKILLTFTLVGLHGYWQHWYYITKWLASETTGQTYPHFSRRNYQPFWYVGRQR